MVRCMHEVLRPRIAHYRVFAVNVEQLQLAAIHLIGCDRKLKAWSRI